MASRSRWSRTRWRPPRSARSPPETRSTSRPTCSPSTWRGSRGYDLRMATTTEPQTFATIEENNPRKLESAVAYGLTVVEEVPIEVPPNVENRSYLQAKREKLGHRLHHQDLKFEPDAE